MSQTIVVETPEPENAITPQLLEQATQLGQTTEQVSQLQTQTETQANELQELRERLEQQEMELQQLRNQPPIIQTVISEPEITEEPKIEMITPPEPETEPEPEPMEVKKTPAWLEWLLK